MKFHVYSKINLGKFNVSKVKKSPVYIVCYQNKQRFWLKTGVDTQFGLNDNGELFDYEENRAPKNHAIKTMLYQCEAYELQNMRKPFEVKRRELHAMFGQGDTAKSGHNLADILREYGQTKRTISTQTIYSAVADTINDFSDNAFVSAESIDRKWAKKYAEFLLRRLKPTSVAIYVSKLSALYDWMIDEEMTNANPFLRLRLPRIQTEPKYFDISDVRYIRDAEIPNNRPKQIIARDMWMLSFYLCGISPVDLFGLSNNAIVKGRIRIHRQKTGSVQDIPVTPEARELIKKYRGTKHLLTLGDKSNTCKSQILFSAFKTANKNGLLPKMSMKDARTAFATIAASLGCSDEDIALCLGHSWISNTVTGRHYIRRDYSRVDNVVNKVISAVNKDKK